MKVLFRSAAFFAIAFTLFSTPASTRAADSASASPADDKFDRLDGTGPSGKKIHVVEWEGNLEIHAYPAGSIKSLAFKLDKTNKDKPVMVIGYRFMDRPDVQLVRRAILGVPFDENFKVFKDPTESDFDKYVISMNGLAKPLIAYKPEAAPKQLYPDGHPMLAQGQSSGEDAANAAAESRKPAGKVREEAEARARQEQEEESERRDSGTIRPFFSNRGGGL